jgi:FkbM family methyltransferase
MDLRGMGFGVITQGYLLGEIVPLLEYFPKDAVVLDIGSNIGVWSRMFAQRVPDGKVFAFEPSPSTFQLLVKNCSEYPNIVCVPSALGAESGTIGFCEDMEPALRYVVSKPNGAKATTSVPVSRLDDWVSAAGLTRIDFIKIDVEGAEEELIDGAIATLERLQPTILFEFIPWVAQERSKFKGRMIFATLGKLGYRLLRIDRDGFLYENFMNPEEWTNDYLAVPPSSRFRPAVDKLLKV